MFTGIIESTGIVQEIIDSGANKTYIVQSNLSSLFKIDQSVAHSGVCLTIENINANTHSFTAISETLLKTNLNTWQKGTIVNIERCVEMNGRLDGHIVQGHVDTVATCINKQEKNGSYEFCFEFDENFAALIIEKGSIAVNGVSLTIFNISKNTFTVAIIPYTYEHTNLSFIEPQSTVNIEFDMVGKYIVRAIDLKNRV